MVKAIFGQSKSKNKVMGFDLKVINKECGGGMEEGDELSEVGEEEAQQGGTEEGGELGGVEEEGIYQSGVEE